MNKDKKIKLIVDRLREMHGNEKTLKIGRVIPND